MARPALSAARAVDVLNFLAAHPDESFTLSELVRRVGVNVASMHAVLAVLVQHEYVTRSEEKTYTLGPMLVPLGHAALVRHGVIDVARQTAETLSAELGLTALLVGAAGSEMVIIHEANRGTAPARTIGQRIRMLAPIGGVFFAWAESDAVDDWLASSPRSVRGAESDVRRWLASVRERGYAIGLETEARQGLRRAVVDLSESPGSRAARGRLRTHVTRLGDLATVVIEPDPSESYAVAHLAAPIRVHSTRLALYLIGFRRDLTAFEIEQIGQRLQTAAFLTVETATHRASPVAAADGLDEPLSIW
ncbi:MAG: helix-turn-helix domain-containing protein [Acidimicrobiales bacterium]|nr:helix-turn-helix domain-containing protein [Acidimicrobiales bacterium]